MCTPLKLDICHSLVNPLQANIYWSFQGGASFVDPFCYLCFMLVLVMPPCLFLAALLLPAGMGWPLGFLVCGVFLCFLLLFHMMSRLGCGGGCINS